MVQATPQESKRGEQNPYRVSMERHGGGLAKHIRSVTSMYVKESKAKQASTKRQRREPPPTEKQKCQKVQNSYWYEGLQTKSKEISRVSPAGPQSSLVGLRVLIGH